MIPADKTVVCCCPAAGSAPLQQLGHTPGPPCSLRRLLQCVRADAAGEPPLLRHLLQLRCEGRKKRAKQNSRACPVLSSQRRGAAAYECVREARVIQCRGKNSDPEITRAHLCGERSGPGPRPRLVDAAPSRRSLQRRRRGGLRRRTTTGAAAGGPRCRRDRRGVSGLQSGYEVHVGDGQVRGRPGHELGLITVRNRG